MREAGGAGTIPSRNEHAVRVGEVDSHRGPAMAATAFSLTDIDSINAAVREWAEPGVAVHPLRIERLIVLDDALPALRDEVRRLAGRGRVLLLSDQTPKRRGHGDLLTQIESELANVASVHTLVVPEDIEGPFHADIESSVRLSERLHEHQLLVAVGSGSITDGAKYARHYLHAKSNVRLPLISWPTAASVTAYTSALAVMTVEGVKRTLDSEAPDVVICDRATLRAAPVSMTQAGFGDVLARSVSAADWWLSFELGMTDDYSAAPMRLLQDAEQRMFERAVGVRTGAPAAVDAVTDAILLAGMAMSLMNQTAPLSGWEHAISHFLDLAAGAERRATALHGAQVGVATRVSALAYERGWPRLESGRLLVETDADAARQAIERVFRQFDAREALLDELWRDYQKKLTRRAASLAQRRRFVERCRAGELDSQLRSLVRSAEDVGRLLATAGAPMQFSALSPAPAIDSVRAAIASSHLIRARFTFGDLLAEGGWLTDAAVDGLLAATL
ncbi:MAG: iron-containing alcohol dehydrogenase [Planctomycetota bacterium]|nr:MAG: iron-containing alcohol dehydrogenase [Planctomycetota bacterium]